MKPLGRSALLLSEWTATGARLIKCSNPFEPALELWRAQAIISNSISHCQFRKSAAVVHQINLEGRIEATCNALKDDVVAFLKDGREYKSDQVIGKVITDYTGSSKLTEHMERTRRAAIDINPFSIFSHLGRCGSKDTETANLTFTEILKEIEGWREEAETSFNDVINQLLDLADEEYEHYEVVDRMLDSLQSQRTRVEELGILARQLQIARTIRK